VAPNHRYEEEYMSRVRRWRFWVCYQGEDKEDMARGAIKYLESRGFKAKIWAPRPEHKTSDHTHVVVLATLKEVLRLGGVESLKVRVFCPVCKGGDNAIWEGSLIDWGLELQRVENPEWFSYAIRHEVAHPGHVIMVEYPDKTVPLRLGR